MCTVCENLPLSISKVLNQLIVNRNGTSDDSCMITKSIDSFIVPHRSYLINYNKLTECTEENLHNSQSENTSDINFIKIKADWKKEETVKTTGANILGGMGIFDVDYDKISIPVTSIEHVNFYGCRLLKNGDVLKFDTPCELPVTTMYIGKNYIQDYIFNEKMGGGHYLEYHNLPHFHMPLDEKCDGYLILGKNNCDEYFFSAFKIPYGYSIYTPPYVLHNDSFLTGNYKVVYHVADIYSTVLIKNKDNMVKIEIMQ